MMKLKVAVVGGGAAGLCALRHLLARPELFAPTGFEQLPGVGGTWRYTEAIGTYDNGLPVQSSMYRNLRTNLPKEVMAFPGYPFPSNLPSFIMHEDVLKYLEGYAQHYDILKFMKLETTVSRVEPMQKNTGHVWKVTSSSGNSTVEHELFDAVIVCNGHYAVPLVPHIIGDDVFNGTIIHSHDYRVPETYKNQTVLCLGAAASGQDISLDIATEAKKVILSHKPRLQTPLPSNMCQKPGIDRLTKNTVIYLDGEEEQVDVVILCTGYRYSFPFLSEECALNIEDERVTPLYKHIIHAKYPTLSFIGICKTICPFPQFENQVRFVLSILDGSQRLPCTEEMLEDIEADFKERLDQGLPKRYAHTMGPRQWAYNDSLAEMGMFTPIPKAVQILYDEVHRVRVLDLPQYKQKQYRLTGDETFEEVFVPDQHSAEDAS